MECSDQRHLDEAEARVFMEQMSDEALSRIIDMMREAVRTSPRSPRPALQIVKDPDEILSKKT